MGEVQRTPLIRQNQETYGETFTAHLFEQYKLYVESAERISERRISANNFLLTVNASLITLYGLMVVSHTVGRWGLFLIPCVGLLVCFSWHNILISYRNLNTIKFQVIHELEQAMPAALYCYEWQKAEAGKGTIYKPLSHLECWIPRIFMGFYFVLVIVSFFGTFE